jgi:hypothetical protein
VRKVNIEEGTVRVCMAKRRKVEYEEGTVECFYCRKPVYDNSWKCQHCGKWFREGRISVLGIIAIFAIVIVMLVYIFQPSFVFGGEEEETQKRYGILLDRDPGPAAHKAEPGGYTSWVVQMTSLSNVADNFEFSSVGAQGLQVSYDNPIVGLTSGQQFINIIRVDVPINTSPGTINFNVYATSKEDPTASDSLDLMVDVVSFSTRTVVEGDLVQCHYVLYIEEEGILFQNSYAELGDTLKVSMGATSGEYTSVITGFYEGLLGMKVGEIKTQIVPPNKGYTDPSAPLFGKTLIFQIELARIDTA